MRSKERMLAAIMFTDIVGYSAMMQKDEITASRLRARHREVFDRITTQYGGEILQYFGDGTLSIFSSATAATECAVALQQALKKDPQVPIRIGIHTGEITYNNEEAYGDGVNIASRLESLCVPGGIFISSKVYDEIKNHARLKAKPIGRHHVKNIQQDIDVFAVSNAGITSPGFELPQPPVYTAPSTSPAKGRKNKWVTFLLAFFFGVFGVHRFYLEQRLRGFLHMAVFFLAVFMHVIPPQAVGILGIIGFIDAMIFLAMPRADFDRRFNSGQAPLQQPQDKRARQAGASDTKQLLQEQFNSCYSKAVTLHRNYDYDSATRYLQQALEIRYDAPEAHFLLACCFSVNENTEKAFFHLDLASAFGLQNLEERIRTDGDLSFLRIQPQFDAFAQNGYRILKELPEPQADLLDNEPDLDLQTLRKESVERGNAPTSPAKEGNSTPEDP